MENRSRWFQILRFTCFLGIGLIMMLLLDVNLSHAQATPNYKWRVAGVQAQGWPHNDGLVHFAAKVFERTNGNVKITVYPGMQLGDPVKLFESCQRGTIDLAICVPYPFIDPRFNIVNLPYLVEDFNQADRVFYGEGWFNSFIRKIYEDKKIKFLGGIENEFRGISNSKRPIKAPDDLKGMKLRDGGVPTLNAFLSVCGGKSINVPFAELYTALQQGIVDGQDNGPVNTFMMKFQEAQRYYTWLKHSFNMVIIGMNLDLFNSLPADIQKILLEEGKEAERIVANEVRGVQLKCLNSMQLAGMQIYEPTPKETLQFKEIGRSIWPQFEDKIGKENMAKLREQMKALGMN